MVMPPLSTVTPIRPPAQTEQAVMREFVISHQDKLRFDHERGIWLFWQGHHWHPDKRKKAFFWALEYCYRLGMKKAERVGFANAVENASRAMESIATETADWNPHLSHVACPGGVIELENGGVLRPGKPDDMIDRALTVTPDAAMPGDTWFGFLDTMFGGDGEVIDFLQRWCGYCLSGIISEQKFLFLHGTGANGKGTLLSTLATIWGRLSTTASIDVFLESQTDRHPTELAKLNGTHMVQVHETREGRRWDEAKIKAMTGGDPISARFMRQDQFEFIPRFKPMFAGNHRPQLRTVDEAMRRRFLLLPCTITVPADQRDPKLGEKLQAEAPRILAWAVEGFDHWQRLGLQPPAAITDATEEYLLHQDDLQLWIDEKLQLNPTAKITAKALFADWKNWQDQRGGWAGSERALNDRLRDKGFKSLKSMVGIEFVGIEFSYAAPP